MFGVLPSLWARLLFYIHGQAASVAHYLRQEALQMLCGWIPGPVGLVVRGVVYRMMLRVDGYALIEAGVRLRRTDGIALGRGAWLRSGAYLHGCPGGIVVGEGSVVARGTELHTFNFRDLPHAYIKIGRGTRIDAGVVIRGQGGVDIGDDVLVAPRACIIAAQHNFDDATRPIVDQYITAKGIVVEDGAVIGPRAVLLDGVRVGKGAIVAAGAVVSRDVPAYSYAEGVPARIGRHPTPANDPFATATPAKAVGLGGAGAG